MLLIVLSLVAYFLLATSVFALITIPTIRGAARLTIHRTASACLVLTRQVSKTTRKFFSSIAYNTKCIAHYFKLFEYVFHRWITFSACLLIALPTGALVWRNLYALETFDHTATYSKDERVAALLAGERLTPPAPLPPEIFLTREVAAATPLARFASRDWMLLDEEFRQRILTVYRIMLERHGYEMVLLEGYLNRPGIRGGHLV